MEKRVFSIFYDSLGIRKLTSRQVFSFNMAYAGKPWPGYVHKKHRKRASSNQLGEMIFTVKYYAGIIDRDKRAKKNVEYTWKELLDELITADNAVRFDPIVPATEKVTPAVVENQQNE